MINDARQQRMKVVARLVAIGQELNRLDAATSLNAEELEVRSELKACRAELWRQLSIEEQSQVLP